ncbi:PAS domain-containing sensor histidine kinase [Paenibacillus sp. J31TS4]|uniref:two-component system histidine kinase PnpS n=1 Tax=Paenibacillus sp. J31TS4 TaxID=2807195 RepID=UPI001B126F50|nr:ATP-binding protein [Paenibacillus sp. J31TS4]GIP38237.1 PAS domain-containing sensor histidine kinase [Paenibacillus sp. J31TS4]
MNKFRNRLTALFVLLIGLSLAGAGVFTAQLIKTLYIESQQDNLAREIRLLQVAYRWDLYDAEASRLREYQDRIAYLKESAGARITLIRADGTVVGDSDQPPETMDNHSGRKEIVEAKEAGIGYSIRHSATLDADMLYVALPLREPGGAITGYIRLAMGLAHVDASLKKLWLFLFAGLGVLTLLAGVVSYRLAHGLTRPIEKMMRVARQITNMHYGARVKIRTRDEVGQLGAAINTMAGSLQTQMNRIRKEEERLKNVLENMQSGVMMIDAGGTIALLNRSGEEFLGISTGELLGREYGEARMPFELAQMIQECLDTRQPVRDEMIVYYPEERILEVSLNPIAQEDEEEGTGALVVLHNITALRRLERVRSEFVANVSHELKTPVAAVKGFAETLLAGAMNDTETARAFLQIIYDESERLNRLIGDILELSKIESKRVPLQYSPVDLPEFLAKTVQMMQAEADKKNIRLEAACEPSLFMEADEDRLRQILINLLSNGINYTPEGGRVRVTAEPVLLENGTGDYDKIRIAVSDTGIGIPKKDLPRIFERFYRVDKARSRSSGGTGLGLSIVKHLVELHHGTITVESEHGAGTRFLIELPVVQEQPGRF